MVVGVGTAARSRRGYDHYSADLTIEVVQIGLARIIGAAVRIDGDKTSCSTLTVCRDRTRSGGALPVRRVKRI